MTIGATFMIFNLASDPFIQQIVTFQPQISYQDDPTVSVPRAINYTKGLVFPIEAAVLSGFSAGNASEISGLSVACPGRQCVYPPFRTLGFCSQCQNSTSSLKQIANFSEYFNRTWKTQARAFTFNNVFLANPISRNGNQDYAVMNVSLANLSNPISDQLLAGREKTLTVALFSMINITDMPTVTRWPNCNLSATECALSLCIQEVQSNFTNGTLLEAVISKQAELLPSTTVTSAEATTTTNPTINTTLPWPFNVDVEGGQIEIYDPSQPNSHYIFTSHKLHNIRNWFDILFGRWEGNVVSSLNGTARLDFAPPEVEAIYISENLTRTFVNVAAAMSHSMRQNADSSPRVPGAIIVEQTVVIVRWAWISLPLGTTLLGLIFLVITIQKTYREQIPVWKSDHLPLVLHGITPAQDPSQSEKCTTVSAMENRAEDMLIGMSRESKSGLRLQTSINIPTTKNTSAYEGRSSPHPPKEIPRKGNSQKDNRAQRSVALTSKPRPPVLDEEAVKDTKNPISGSTSLPFHRPR